VPTQISAHRSARRRADALNLSYAPFRERDRRGWRKEFEGNTVQIASEALQCVGS